MARGIIVSLVVGAVGYGLIAFGTERQVDSKGEVGDGALIAGAIVLATFVVGLMEMTRSNY